MSFRTRRKHGRFGGALKHFIDAVASLCRTLDVAMCLDVPTQLCSFARADRPLVARTAVSCPWIVPQVGLGTDEDDRCPRTEVADLGNPLERHVGEAVSVVDWKADDDDVGVGVRQRAQLLVVFLTCRVPQRELNCLSVHLTKTYVHGC